MSVEQHASLTVLLVEDQESEAYVIQRLLNHSESQSFSVVHSPSLADAVTQLATGDFDVCLLDLGLPDGSGIDSLHQIRSVDARIPIVVLTGNDCETLGLATIESGAQDFVAKDAISAQLLSRSLRFSIARQRKMLGHAADANTDQLTGMPNRRRLNDSFNELSKGSDSLSVALIDIDHFKNVNDNHGHLVGDRVLQHIGELIQTAVGGKVQCARFGGEEFALLLPNTSVEETYLIACELLSEIEAAVMKIDDKQLKITASVGVSAVESGDTLEDTLSRTDAALYQAKRSGRNQVCIKNR